MTDKNIYSEQEVREATEEYFDGDELATNVWTTKYALRDVYGNFLEKTPEDMHWRLASEFARIEDKFGGENKLSKEKIFNYFDHFDYIVPQGSPMYGIGNDYQKVSLSNCVVIDSPEDSVSSIMDSGKNLANLFKRRCGVGVDISTLRPEGEAVRNAAGTTTGAWSFADFYSYVCRMIGQNGRRGALMITMNVNHPDIFKFVRMKRNLEKVTGANVSVKITDDFMEAVRSNDDFELRWDSEDGSTVSETIKAQDLWDEIIKSATECAEPGLLMWDNITSRLPAHCYPEFETISTNPCSEIALSPGDSCRLISINLKNFVKNPFQDDAYFDYDHFRRTVKDSMRLIDDLVELEKEKLEGIIQLCDDKSERALWEQLLDACVRGRRTGLGTHGLADALARLRFPYDSDEAIDEVDSIYTSLRDSAYGESVQLAKERGTFPAFDWELEKGNEYIQELPEDILNGIRKYGRRNISILTNAPTGSVSICSQTSSGIEPVFRNAHVRRRKLSHNELDIEPDFVDDMGDRWKEYKVFHHNVREYMDMLGGDSVDDLPEFFVQSDDIDWRKRVEIQAALQNPIDHSVSSTINLPSGIDTEVVGDLYFHAWEKGLKGVTVYVDGSRSGVLVEDSSSEDDGQFETYLQVLNHLNVPGDGDMKTTEDGVIVSDVAMPDTYYNGPTKKIRREGNKYYMHFSYLTDEKKFPVALWIHSNNYEDGEYVTLNRACRAVRDLLVSEGVSTPLVLDQVEKVAEDAYHVKLGKVISMALRHNIPAVSIVEAMENIEGDYVATTLSAVRKFLGSQIEDGTEVDDKECSMCGEDSIVFEDGCFVCKSCGNSKCS